MSEFEKESSKFRITTAKRSDKLLENNKSPKKRIRTIAQIHENSDQRTNA